MRTPRHTYRIGATEAAKTFGGIVHQVRETQAEFTVERAGVAVARIVPVRERRATVADLVALLRPHATGGPDFARTVRDGVRAQNRRAVPRDPWGS